MTSSSCLDLEAIAAYLDGRSADSERAEISEHLNACEECYEIFAGSAREISRRPHPDWRRYVLPITGLAAAAAMALMVQGGVFRRAASGRADLKTLLVVAVGARRTIEP